MKAALKKALIEVFGLDEATVNKLADENTADTEIEGILPAMSLANRQKWETFLEKDTAFTQKFTNAGFSAGEGKAYSKIKTGVLQNLGIDIALDSEDFQNNEAFTKKVKDLVGAKIADAAKGSEDVETYKKTAQTEFQSRLAAELEAQQNRLNGEFQSRLITAQRESSLDSTLTTFAASKKFKGGLDALTLMPSVKALANNYKFEFDSETHKVIKVTDKEGNQLKNERGDGFLEVADVLDLIYKPFIDQTTEGGGEGGSGGKTTVKVENQPEILTTTLNEMQSLR